MSSTKIKQRKPKLNVRLLRRVKRYILAEPRRLFMAAVYTNKEREGGRATFMGDGGEQRFAPCGTAACIAGWTLVLSKRPLVSGGAGMSAAARLLGVGDKFGYGIDGGRLFHVCHWPAQFEQKYYKAKTPAARAKIAADRIEHFIKTSE